MSLWDWLLAAWIYEELFDDTRATARTTTLATMIHHTITMIMGRICNLAGIICNFESK